MARVRPFNMNGRSPTVPRDTHCCCSQTLNCNSTSTFSCRLECNVSLLYTGVSAVLLWAPCHCGRRVTLSAVSLWAPCHCERRVTLSFVSLWAPCHCERRVTMGAVSLWAPCQCGRRVTVSAVSLWAPCHCGRRVTVSAVSLWALARAEIYPCII